MSLAVAAAERVERAGGPRAGLFAWKKLADGATSSDIRGRALLAALRCGIALRDAAAIAELVQAWGTITTGVWDVHVAAVCKELSRAGYLSEATRLAALEAKRAPTARALYLHARCLELATDRAAASAFESTIACAAREGVAEIERAARIRRAVTLSRSPETRAEAVREAQRVDAKLASPEEKLALAGVLLSASSRFARTAATGLLDELVMQDSPLVPEARLRATRAVRMAAAHADGMGAALSAMEVDRLLGVFSRSPSTASAKSALLVAMAMARSVDEGVSEASKTLPELARLHKRARDILEDRHVPGGTTTWDGLLDVASALRSASPQRARLALDALRGAPSLPPQTWTILQVALETGDAELRDSVASVARELDGVRPPRGWLSVATSLSLAGLDELATDARRHAAAAGEPGAADALVVTLTRSAWQLASAGERARAIARLREAKALSEATNPST